MNSDRSTTSEATDLLSRVAHDFSNVLMTIELHAEMIVDGSPAVVDEAKAILRAAECGTRLARQLLDLYGDHIGRTRRVDIDAAIRGMEGMLRVMLGRGMSLGLTLAGAPVGIDLLSLEKVILNLVTNARDAMSDGGRLTISTRQSQGMVELVVADTGHGIPSDLMAAIFDPFVTGKPSKGGTGLGLSIVREMVVGVGGRVSAESSPEGTVMCVLLPMAAR